MKVKKIVLITLLIILMTTIFFFSSENGNKSNSTSDKVTIKVIDTITSVTKKEISSEKKQQLVLDYRLIIRKSAHFTLYFLLGVVAYLTLSSFSINKTIIFSLMLCFIYACTDEFHQLFSLNRTASFLDVLIDTTGSLCGILIAYFINKKVLNRKSKVANNAH